MSKISIPKDNLTIKGKTGALIAEFGYWEKKPAIVLKAKVPRESNAKKRYLIRMDDIWLYSEDHYAPVHDGMPKTYESFMLHKCLDLYELFDLGTPGSRQLAEVAWLIQDSIGALLEMPPYEERKVPVGEAEMTIRPLDGSEPQTIKSEVYDDLAE